jgi:tRNA modification GTPase
MSRAICAAVAGTTRDVLSAPVRLGSQEAILLDAAGIDESPDEIIASARELALSAATTSDLVCVVFDAQSVKSEESRPFLAILRSREIHQFVIALNKCDLLSESEANRLASWLIDESKMPAIPVSALRGDGIDDLKTALSATLQSAQTTVSSEATAFSERQRSCLATALESMSRAASLAESAESTSQCADLLAFELREALDAIGEVTGEVTTEDLLTQIFANFCIGK